MKNIHILTTGKPSRLLRGLDGIRLFENEVSPDNQWCVNVNIHITNDEELKDGDKRINNYQRKPKGEEIPSKKIILTTDQDLIKDGVQAIDDEFLEWFVKNPSCESVEVVKEKVDLSDLGHYEIYYKYKIIIRKEEPKQDTINYSLNAFKVPKEYFGKEEPCTCTDECFGYLAKTCRRIEEEPKQETLEEVAQKIFPVNFSDYDINNGLKQEGFITGAKWRQERMYSEEEVVSFIHKFLKEHQPQLPYLLGGINMWFGQYKKTI